MATNFKDLLSVPVTSAEKPKPRPAGQYFGMISAFKFDESKNQKTPLCRLTFKNIQPGQGISNDANLMERLRASGGTDKWSPFKDYYLTPDALYRMRGLLESCKIRVEGRSFAESIPELMNQPIVFEVTEESYEDKEGATSITNRIGEVRGA
jgi:hypothetical protein